MAKHKIGQAGIPLEKFTKKEQKKIITIMNNIWNTQTNAVTRQRVMNALASEQIPADWVEEITDNFEEFKKNQYNPTMGVIVLAAGSATMLDINNAISTEAIFNVNTEPSLQWINKKGGEFIQNLNNQQTAGMNAIIEQAILNDYSTAETMNLLKAGIPVTKKEAISLGKQYQSLLDGGMKKKDALNKLRRVAAKARRVRSERIARTEIARAKGFGDHQAFNQIIQSGKAKEATKTWIRTNHKDNWPSSTGNDGSTKGLNEPYDVPNDDGSDQYPGEINELCVEEFNIIT